MGWDCASVVVCPRKNKSEKHVEKKEHESITGENVNACGSCSNHHGGPSKPLQESSPLLPLSQS